VYMERDESAMTRDGRKDLLRFYHRFNLSFKRFFYVQFPLEHFNNGKDIRVSTDSKFHGAVKEETRNI